MHIIRDLTLHGGAVNGDHAAVCISQLHTARVHVELTGDQLPLLTLLGYFNLKKLCDGLDIGISEFFASPLFDDLEQEIK